MRMPLLSRILYTTISTKQCSVPGEKQTWRKVWDGRATIMATHATRWYLRLRMLTPLIGETIAYHQPLEESP
jgi:hypothetical protein